MSCWALIPVKARRGCKTRLASNLSPEQRLLLVRTVLSHVLTTIQRSPRIDYVGIVSPERDQVSKSIEVLPEQGQDLNTSLMMAMASTRARGAKTILILHSDLPNLSTMDIEALLNAADKAKIAIAPDENGEGTNALCLGAGMDIPLQFGFNSFRSHLSSALAQGIKPAVIKTPGLGFDLDDSSDLEKYYSELRNRTSEENCAINESH